MIEARSLTKKYGQLTAVDALSFSVEPGVVTGFLGPNGAGKSTTMRMILGLDRPTARSVVRIFPKRYSLVTASAASTRITAEANCMPARVKKIALPSSDWDVINTPKAIGMSTASPCTTEGSGWSAT